MEEIRTCPVCGGKFTDRTRKYCSPKCSKEGYRRRQAKYSIDRYHTEKENRQKVAGRIKKVSPLEEAARKAREAGMTYGQYVALGCEKIKETLYKEEQKDGSGNM